MISICYNFVQLYFENRVELERVAVRIQLSKERQDIWSSSEASALGTKQLSVDVLLNELGYQRSLHGNLRPMKTSVAVNIFWVDEEPNIGRQGVCHHSVVPNSVVLLAPSLCGK